MFNSGPPGSPTATLYEVIGDVELNPAAQTGARPSQLAITPKPQESERISNPEQISIPEQTRLS